MVSLHHPNPRDSRAARPGKTGEETLLPRSSNEGTELLPAAYRTGTRMTSSPATARRRLRRSEGAGDRRCGTAAEAVRPIEAAAPGADGGLDDSNRSDRSAVPLRCGGDRRRGSHAFERVTLYQNAFESSVRVVAFGTSGRSCKPAAEAPASEGAVGGAGAPQRCAVARPERSWVRAAAE